MKYTVWALKNKNTGEFYSYTTGSFPELFYSREMAREIAKFDLCQQYKPVKISVSMKEAA